MKNNRPKVSADLIKAENDFKQAIALTRSMFADKAFRKYLPGESDENPTGSWETKRVVALADVQLWGMTRFERGQIVGRADDIYEAALELLVEPTFQDLITNNTSDKRRVERRFEMWKLMMDDVMVGSERGPRIFPRSIKQGLWDEGQVCARCKQQIRSVDDAHVDHLVPWAKGGRTVRDNGQLMHRYCNRVKGAGQ